MVVKDAVRNAQKPLSEWFIKTKSIDAVLGNKTCVCENCINSTRTHTHTDTHV